MFHTVRAIKSDYLPNSINQSVFVMDMPCIFCEVFSDSCKIDPDVNKDHRRLTAVLHMIWKDGAQSQKIAPFLQNTLWSHGAQGITHITILHLPYVLW